MRKHLIILLALFVLTLTSVAQDAAEPEPLPFMRALSLIPDTALVREATPLFSYADYHAALAARGIERPERLVAFLDDREVYGPILPALPLSGHGRNVRLSPCGRRRRRPAMRRSARGTTRPT